MGNKVEMLFGKDGQRDKMMIFVHMFKICAWWGLGRWLSGHECWLLIHRTRASLPSIHIATHNHLFCFSRGCVVLGWYYLHMYDMVHKHTRWENTHTYKIKIKQISKIIFKRIYVYL